jgi:hypothetical protein
MTIYRDDFMKVDGWILRRLKGFHDTPSTCWAEHECYATEAVRNRNDQPVYGWYPRDNAYFGACCYCGAGCPEEIMGAFLMLNADYLYHWKPNRWARRGPCEVKRDG